MFQSAWMPRSLFTFSSGSWTMAGNLVINGTDGKFIQTATLDNASGNEVAYQLNYTTNKAAGNDTGLEINMTDTASPGTSFLIEATVGGVSKFSVNSAGYMISRNWRMNIGQPYGVDIGYVNGGVNLGPDVGIQWGNTSENGAFDIGLIRSAAGILKVTNGAAGYGVLAFSGGKLIVGTMTETAVAQIKQMVSKYNWTNAMVTALGAVVAGDVTVCTLPAKTVVKNAYIVIDTAATNMAAATLTVSFGRTAAAYADYLAAGDAKAAANTVYGDAAGERGANLTSYDLPSYTATTDVKCHFDTDGAGGKTLADVLTCAGSVFIETVTLP